MSNLPALHHDVSEIERMARAIAGSNLFGITKPEQAITLCLIAQAEGRHPASAAQDYHIIQGKPAKKADAMLRDFLSGGGKVKWHVLDDKQADATFSHPAGGEVRITWDMERAKMAGLATPMWKKYPRQMLRSRTVSEGVRTVYPMATSGMYVPEEVQDFDAPAQPAATVVDASANEQQQIEAPKSKAESRGTYDRLSKANNGLDTLEKFNKFWSQDSVLDAAESLPPDWAKTLLEEKNDKFAELDERAAMVADDDVPFGDRGDYVPPQFDQHAA